LPEDHRIDVLPYTECVKQNYKNHVKIKMGRDPCMVGFCCGLHIIDFGVIVDDNTPVSECVFTLGGKVSGTQLFSQL
jgi:hypothetical protein